MSEFNNTLNTSTTNDRLGTEPSHVFLPWNNPWNIISYETRLAIVAVAQIYIFPCVFLVGVSTNILNCVVFYRQGLRDRMNLCLFWLAIMDMCYLITLSTDAAISFVALVDPWFARKFQVFALYCVSGIFTGFGISSGCVTAVIAVERCVCVVFPLKAQSLLTTRTMAIILTTITVLPQLFFSTLLLRLEPKQVFDKYTGKPTWSLESARRANQDILDFLYYTLFDLTAFVFPIVTMSIVVICTIITAWRLRMASAWRQTTSTSNSSNVQLQQVALTKMLIFISCIFIACSLPLCTLSLIRRTVPEFRTNGKYANIFFASHTVGYDVISVINSSINFFVYCWRSTRYWSEIRILCCCESKYGHDTDIPK